MRLRELGERRLLREVIPRFTDGAGHDCAAFEAKGKYCAVTTDPVPRPVAWSVGRTEDLYWLGWLLVTINGSDIAASGAQPHSFYAALDLPRDLELSEFERLLKGIQASCRKLGFKYAGGNIREAETINAVGTAVGFSESQCLTRRGARAGSWVVAVGVGGLFWSDYLKVKSGLNVDTLTSPLFSPVARTNEMARLHAEGYVECAMDASDGLAPTLAELARVNELDILVDLEAIRQASEELTRLERAERLWMGWGDWLVVISVGEAQVDRFLEAVQAQGTAMTVIGRFLPGEGKVRLRGETSEIMLERLESERFAEDSWFHQGLEGYEEMLRSLPLPG